MIYNETPENKRDKAIAKAAESLAELLSALAKIAAEYLKTMKSK
jgi:hypothetical protein